MNAIFACVPNKNTWRASNFRFLIFGAICLVYTDIFSQIILSGTAIIAARTKDKIVVGADSKGIWDYNTTNPTSVCKIVQIGDSSFFTASNFVAVGGTNYNVYDIAQKSIGGAKSMVDISTDFEKTIKPLLQFRIQKIKQDCVFVYEREYKNRNVLNTFFFGIENGIPIICSIKFITQENALGDMSVITGQKKCPPDCGNNILWIAAGKTDASTRFRRQNPDLWRHIGIEKTIELLINIDATAEHDYVGLPIDIIHVSRDSIYWIQRKPQCKD